MEILGRTNQRFPEIWLSLSVPEDPSLIDPLVGTALETGLPINVSSMPALWGQRLRGSDATLMSLSSSQFQDATDESHACDVTQAHLIEVLSCLGRETLDFYFLRVRRQVEEFQISGALQAFELAKQDGHVRFLGICCDGPSFAALGLWQFHDAFDVLLVPRNHYNPEPYQTLSPLAKERRVGVVTSKPFDWGYGLPFFRLPSQWRLANLAKGMYGQSVAQATLSALSQEHPVLVGVQTEQEVKEAAMVPSLKQIEGLDEFLIPFRQSFENESDWIQLLNSPDARLRKAATLRQAMMA